MNKVSKAILIGGCILLTIVLLVVIGLDIYLRSSGAKGKIAAALSNATKLPVEFSSSSLNPAGGLKITGITVRDGDHKFLDGASLHARCKVLPIFSGRLELDEITLESPHIVWIQNADGRWVLPQLPPEPSRPPGASASPSSPKSGASLQVTAANVHLKNGTIELLDREKKPVASASGFQVHLPTVSASGAEGTVDIDQLGWGETLIFQRLHSPVTWQAGKLALPQIKGTLGEGTVTGSFSMKEEQPKSPFELAVKLEKVNAAALTKNTKSAIGQASGVLSGNFAFTGYTSEFSRLKGTGRVELASGRLKQFDIIESLAVFFPLPQLRDFQLRQAFADLHVGSQRVTVDQLILDSGDIGLTARGFVKFDGRIELESQLSMNKSLSDQLPDFVRENLTSAPDNRFAVTFDVRGEKFRPRTNIESKIGVRKITRQVEDLFSSLFPKKKKDDAKKEEARKKEKEKKKSEPVPAPPSDGLAPAPAEAVEPPPAPAPAQ